MTLSDAGAPQIEDRYHSVKEVAAYFMVTDQTVREWIASGKLAAVKAGKSWRVTKQAMVNMVNAK